MEVRQGSCTVVGGSAGVNTSRVRHRGSWQHRSVQGTATAASEDSEEVCRSPISVRCTAGRKRGSRRTQSRSYTSLGGPVELCAERDETIVVWRTTRRHVGGWCSNEKSDGGPAHQERPSRVLCTAGRRRPAHQGRPGGFLCTAGRKRGRGQ